MADEIAKTLSAIDESAFTSMLNELRDPDRPWFFTGQGRSGLVANMIAMRFMHLGRRAYVQGDSTSPAIGPSDGMLVVSGSGATHVTVHYARVARRVGARVVGVTRRADSPLARIADTALIIPAQDSIQLGGSLFEQCALLTLDAAVLALSDGQRDVRSRMAALHTNLL